MVSFFLHEVLLRHTINPQLFLLPGHDMTRGRFGGGWGSCACAPFATSSSSGPSLQCHITKSHIYIYKEGHMISDDFETQSGQVMAT